MYPAEHDRRATCPHVSADLVAAKRVARVDPDADHVALLHVRDVEGFQGFVGNLRLAVGSRRCRGEDEQPARGDDADAEGQMARVHQMDSHAAHLSIGPSSFARHEGL